MQSNVPSVSVPAALPTPASPVFTGLRTVAFSLLVDRALSA
ncbi:hypothetical protein [Paraburkholderia acidipaludis]|nr:hypothetical protein [Paraburkholderia acidipaludis]